MKNFLLSCRSIRRPAVDGSGDAVGERMDDGGAKSHVAVVVGSSSGGDGAAKVRLRIVLLPFRTNRFNENLVFLARILDVIPYKCIFDNIK